MTEEQFGELIRILGDVGSSAYQAAAERAFWEAVIYLLIQTALILALIFSTRALWKWARKQMDRDNHEGEADWGFGTKVACVLTLVFMMLLLVSSWAESFITLITPNYAALKLLSDLVIR